MPNQTKRRYLELNKDKYVEYHKAYRTENKETIKTKELGRKAEKERKAKIYRELNKDAIRIRRKEIYDANKAKKMLVI